MLLFLLTSLFLFFNTWFTGVAAKQALEKWLAIQLVPTAIELFLLGLISSFVYFSLLSFFVPVNYLSLFPLFVVALIASSGKQPLLQLYQYIRETVVLFTKKENLLFVVPFVVLFIVHAVLPPSNWDSSGYHYDSIKWYERYKVVPGLANVHARLAYNPANFIISAAYSFTKVFGQAIYPLNAVLAALFYTWVIRKILLSNSLLQKMAFILAAVLLFKITLVNIPCPSADLLSGLLLFYCGIRSFELIKNGKQSFSDYWLLFLLLVFAVTAKLSAIPALVIIPFLFFFVIRKEKKPSLIVQSCAVVAVVLLPWMGRNLIMSGYLLYPVFGTNPVHFDWSVPDDVIKLDYVYSRYGPLVGGHNLGELQRMNLGELLIIWLQNLYRYYFTGLLTVLPAIASPAIWLLFPLSGKTFSRPVFILWALSYFLFWVWVFGAPELRFGLAYVVLTMLLPLLEFSSYKTKSLQLPSWLLAVPFYCCCWHYTLAGIRKDSYYPFSLADCWLKPLRSYRYFVNNDMATFQSVELKNGIKLYLSDWQHECLNVDGPCMIWRYGEIEMRGNRIEDGFRNIKDEVRLNYPFIGTNSK